MEGLKTNIAIDPQGTLDLDMEKYALGRRFFVTKKGHFGPGPADTRPGDRIAVVWGLSVPVALRNHSEAGISGKTVVGETYVCGIMDGEVRKKWHDGYVEAGKILLR